MPSYTEGYDVRRTEACCGGALRRCGAEVKRESAAYCCQQLAHCKMRKCNF
eukprot:SAG11_NODE_2516_length_3265_cov_3.032533_3_plen_51_part_00